MLWEVRASDWRRQRVEEGEVQGVEGVEGVEGEELGLEGEELGLEVELGEEEAMGSLVEVEVNEALDEGRGEEVVVDFEVEVVRLVVVGVGDVRSVEELVCEKRSVRTPGYERENAPQLGRSCPPSCGETRSPRLTRREAAPPGRQ